MHHVDGSTVSVDVSLDACLLGLVWISAESAVEDSSEKTQGEEAADFQNGEDHTEDHGAGDGVTDNLEPSLVEVTLESTSKAEGEWLLAKISIDKEQEEGSVEELHVEGNFSGLIELLSLSGISDPPDKLDAQCSEDKIDTGDEVLEGVEPEENLEGNGGVLSTDLLSTFVAISR